MTNFNTLLSSLHQCLTPVRGSAKDNATERGTAQDENFQVDAMLKTMLPENVLQDLLNTDEKPFKPSLLLA
eukprot:c11155_g1_i1 orf=32-244(-)